VAKLNAFSFNIFILVWRLKTRVNHPFLFPTKLLDPTSEIITALALLSIISVLGRLKSDADISPNFTFVLFWLKSANENTVATRTRQRIFMTVRLLWLNTVAQYSRKIF